MTFADLRVEAFKNNGLNLEHFAETVTITERGKTPRPVVVHITEEQDALLDPQGSESEYEKIVVSCLRDESDADKGGIADPQIGNTQLERSTAKDPDSRPFTYQGEQPRGRYPYRWKLIFQRVRQTAQAARR